MPRITQQLLRARLAGQLSADSPSGNDPDDTYGLDLAAIPDDQTFVEEAFRRILGRKPELAALLHFLEVLKSHSRDFVVASLVESRANGAASQTEAPHPAGTADTHILAEGASAPAAAESSDVPGTTVDLTEIDRIQIPGLFVHEIYRRMLGRNCDPEGFTQYRNLLICGLSKIQVMALVAGSPEGQARGLRFTWHGSTLPAAEPVPLGMRISISHADSNADAAMERFEAPR
jgi:hypothetical protein